MNDKNLTTYDMNSRQMRLDTTAEWADQLLWRHSAGQIQQVAETTDYPFLTRRAVAQVSEEKGFYIPNVITEEGYRANPEFFSAAFGHAKNLSKAKRLLGEALDLTKLMSVALSGESRNRFVQAETACRIIEKKLGKAYERIERHDIHHSNLFLAYFDLKGRTDVAVE